MNDRFLLNRFWNQTDNERGNFGQDVWRNVFELCGIDYIPLCNIQDGGSPKLRSDAIDTVLPDFDAGRGRHRFYADSKTKRNSVLFELANELRHGIDLKAWHEYSHVSEWNAQKCCICVLQQFAEVGRNGVTRESKQWKGALLVNTLQNLGNPIRGFSNQDHMVYWPVKRFLIVAEHLPPQTLWLLGKGESIDVKGIDKSVLHSLIAKKEILQNRLF